MYDKEFENLELGSLALCEETSNNNDVFVLLKEKPEIVAKLGNTLSLEFCAGSIGLPNVLAYIMLFKVKDKIYDLFVDFSEDKTKNLLAKFIVLDKFKFVIKTENNTGIAEMNNVLKEKLKEIYTSTNNIYHQEKWSKIEFLDTKNIIKNKYSNDELWNLFTN